MPAHAPSASLRATPFAAQSRSTRRGPQSRCRCGRGQAQSRCRCGPDGPGKVQIWTGEPMLSWCKCERGEPSCGCTWGRGKPGPETEMWDGRARRPTADTGRRMSQVPVQMQVGSAQFQRRCGSISRVPARMREGQPLAPGVDLSSPSRSHGQSTFLWSGWLWGSRGLRGGRCMAASEPEHVHSDYS